MQLFGIASAWVSAAGLVLDLGGVSLLTWDLFPEFTLTRGRRSFRISSRTLAMHIVGGHGKWRPPSIWQIFGPGGDKKIRDFTRAHLAMHVWLNENHDEDPRAAMVLEALYAGDPDEVAKLQLSELAAVIASAQLRVGLRETLVDDARASANRVGESRQRRTPGLYSPMHLAAAVTGWAKALARREMLSSFRRRPPLLPAVALVLAGFILQLWGTMP